MAPTPVLLPGKSHGHGSLVGCHLWGRTESDTTEATQQQQQQQQQRILAFFLVDLESKRYLRKNILYTKLLHLLNKRADFRLTLGIDTILSSSSARRIFINILFPSMMCLEGMPTYAVYSLVETLRSKCIHLHFQLAFVFSMVDSWTFNTGCRWAYFKTIYPQKIKFQNINLGVIILITGFCLDKKITHSVTLHSDLPQ